MCLAAAPVAARPGAIGAARAIKNLVAGIEFLSKGQKKGNGKAPGCVKKRTVCVSVHMDNVYALARP